MYVDRSNQSGENVGNFVERRFVTDGTRARNSNRTRFVPVEYPRKRYRIRIVRGFSQKPYQYVNLPDEYISKVSFNVTRARARCSDRFDRPARRDRFERIYESRERNVRITVYLFTETRERLHFRHAIITIMVISLSVRDLDGERSRERIISTADGHV